MKYLPLPEFDAVTGALNFQTGDCSVTGGCDLYTTKSTGSDKKLYKNINDGLDSQQAQLLRFGASLSPPQRDAMGIATSPSLLSQSTAFGPLSDHTSRRTFAYLIATLNASHPHYDFSNVLRPGDFKREKNLRRVMANLDSILTNVRGTTVNNNTHLMGGLGLSGGSLDGTAAPAATETVWGPKCWGLIDKEMHLDDCIMFSYQPDSDPFEDDEPAIWSAHYFFFNRACKRVAYLYVRVVPVVSSQSPILSPAPYAAGRRRRGDSDLEGGGATKRARFWLGDRDGQLVESYDDDEDDDGFIWNRGDDGDIVSYDDDYGDEYYDPEVADEDDEESDVPRSPPRGMSEDIASQMEI